MKVLLNLTRKEIRMIKRRSRKGNVSLLVVFILFIVFELSTFHISLWGLDLRNLLIAICEAGLVGGIADWYAVTCLFRNPLGIRVPHGNILAKKKDVIATGLSTVIQKFLPESVIEEKVRALDFHKYGVEFLSEPKFQQELKTKLTQFITQNLEEFKKLSALDKGVGELVILLKKRDFATDIANLIESALKNGFVDIAIPKIGSVLASYIENNRSKFEVEIEARVKSHLWGPLKLFGNNKGQDILDEILDELSKLQSGSSSFSAEVKLELEKYKENLMRDSFDRVTFNVSVEKLLSQKSIRDKIIHAIDELILGILEFIQEGHRGVSNIERLIDKTLVLITTNLISEQENVAIINMEIASIVNDSIKKYALLDRITHLIKNEIISMSEKDFVEYIENQVYDDLQYIRLNGAVVGGCVGGIIYIVTTLL